MASAQRASTVLAGAITTVALIIGCHDSPTKPKQSSAGLQLTVEPNAAAVVIAGTQRFTVVARNASGQVVATPTLTWTSSNPAIATVSSGGVATGVAKGTASITAKSGTVTSAPATLTVTEGCSAILAANTFQGTLDYDWVGVGNAGGFVIHSEQHGRLKATLTRLSTTATQATWTGDVTGTATIEESKTLPTNSATSSTTKGDGAMVTPTGGAKPKMTLVVDVQTCTYQVDANATLNVLRTQPDGSTSRSDVPVAVLHAKGGRPVGTASRVAPDDGRFDGHSQTWAGLNPDQDAFIPLGLAAELMSQSRTEPAVGRAVVSWVLLPR